MLNTTLLLATAITTAAVTSNEAAAGRRAAPSTLPTVTAVQTANIGQALSTGILRVDIVVTSEPNMTIKFSSGILLGKNWTPIGQRSLEVPYANGKRVHMVVNVRLSKHGLGLLRSRTSAKLRFLTWCADEPDKANKLVVTLHR
jgi:hypothetical protein